MGSDISPLSFRKSGREEEERERDQCETNGCLPREPLPGPDIEPQPRQRALDQN